MPAVILKEPGLDALWARIQCYSAGSAPRAAWQDDMLPELRRGRIEIQDAFVAAFWPVVESEAQRYGHLGGETEDLRGEAALALWESAVQYQPSRHRTSFGQYVQNHIHRRVRRAYLHQRGYDAPMAVVPLHPELMGDADEALSIAEWTADIARALKTLSRTDREALAPGVAQGRQSEKERKRQQRARRRLTRAIERGTTT